MELPDVRRLAAIDMHGLHGTRVRRTLVVAEFVIGAVFGTSIGISVIGSSHQLAWQLFGAWIATASLNYVPLTMHALALLQPGALAAELAGVDLEREMRAYTKLQFWIAAPLLFVLLSVGQHRAPR